MFVSVLFEIMNWFRDGGSCELVMVLVSVCFGTRCPRPRIARGLHRSSARLLTFGDLMRLITKGVAIRYPVHCKVRWSAASQFKQLTRDR